MEKKNESGFFGDITYSWVMNTISVLYWAIIIKIVWNWYAPSAFKGAQHLSYVSSVGVSLLIAIGIVALRQESENRGWRQGKWFALETTAHSAWILAFASAVHYLV